MKILFIALILPFALGSCSAHKPSNIRIDSDSIKKTVSVKSSSTNEPTETKVDTVAEKSLRYGFRVKVGGSGKGEIYHYDKKIFSDTSEEYVLDEKTYPIITKTEPNTYELLIETSERPNKNLLRIFKIKNNEVTKKGQIATFDGKPEIIDSILTYHGVWDNGEMWDEKGKRYVVYNPTLYYKFTDTGVQLDTALTVIRIKQKYGSFRGFAYSSKFGYPTDDKGNITDTADRHVLKKE